MEATGDNLCTGRTEYIPGRNQIKKGLFNQFCILGHFKQNFAPFFKFDQRLTVPGNTAPRQFRNEIDLIHKRDVQKTHFSKSKTDFRTEKMKSSAFG